MTGDPQVEAYLQRLVEEAPPPPPDAIAHFARSFGVTSASKAAREEEHVTDLNEIVRRETPDVQALAAAVSERRIQLHLSQEGVAHAGGPSAKTIYAIEQGTEAEFRPSTLRRLDQALQWRPGTSERILAGTGSQEEDRAEERDWAGLAERVRERRLALGLRQGDLEARGGPSNGTVRNIEQAARTKYSIRTLSQLEAALQWQPGTADRILDGQPIEDQSSATPAAPCACVVGSPAWIERELATERRINAIVQVFQGEMQRLLALVEAAGEAKERT